MENSTMKTGNPVANEEDFQKVANKVSTITIIGNVALSLLKLFAGIVAHSNAMISDAIHSASDVFSTFVVIIGIRPYQPAADNPSVQTTTKGRKTMRNTSKMTTLENRFPLLAVEHGCIISKDADITVAFEVELPELYTVTGAEYEAIHSCWCKAIKVLPDYSVVHKQDWFIKERYKPELQKDDMSFLSRSFERHLWHSYPAHLKREQNRSCPK